MIVVTILFLHTQSDARVHTKATKVAAMILFMIEEDCKTIKIMNDMEEIQKLFF